MDSDRQVNEYYSYLVKKMVMGSLRDKPVDALNYFRDN